MNNVLGNGSLISTRCTGNFLEKIKSEMQDWPGAQETVQEIPKGDE